MNAPGSPYNNLTTSPNRRKGTRAPPVNGVANGGMMKANERSRRLSESTSRAGRGAQED